MRRFLALILAAGMGCAEQSTKTLDMPPAGPGPLESGTFVVTRMAVAGRDRGFDLGGRCGSSGLCVNNVLWHLGEIGNRSFTDIGDRFLIVEVAGSGAAVTLRMYVAMSASSARCCDFVADRATPAILELRAARDGEHLMTFTTTAAAVLRIPVKEPAFAELDRVRVALGPDTSSAKDLDGVLGGAFSIATLAALPAQASARFPPRATLLDQATTDIAVQPDIDLDGDGLECVFDSDGDGHIDRCCDGAGASPCRDIAGNCTGSEIPPVDPSRRDTCALDPRMADGFSVAFSFLVQPAHVELR